jgi:glycine reductase
MVKAIENQGIAAVHVCTIVPISVTVRANRIVPSVAIPYPTGNPELTKEEELDVRKNLLLKTLEALSTRIDEQTIF